MVVSNESLMNSADLLKEVKDAAFLRLPDGSIGLGIGPFESSSTVPEGDAFYINDFALEDEHPWKIPARMVWLDEEAALNLWREAEEKVLRIEWKVLEPEWFEMVFRRIRKEVVARRLQKMVPVLSEQGKMRAGGAEVLLRRVLEAPKGLWAYGRICDGDGFTGATPELLLSVEGKRLETMALAGTASPSEKTGSFEIDAKEIEEHELVARFVEGALQGLGEVQRSEREVSDAAGLTHFRTKLSVEMEQGRDLSELVRLLHPTPAVGCLPRDEETMVKLMEYRRQLHAPEFFGAPFGLKSAKGFHAVVAIRGLSWKQDEVSMPSGCGVVAGSVFDHEWRELKQKREAVARMLGV